MNNPKVSIVIPVYNGANYLREAIDSAISQTYDNKEILVVNDGSTDDTRNIALSYGNSIRYYEKENGGVSSALNLAIDNMQGDFFSWLSHDDIYYPDKLQVEVDEFQKHKDVVAIYSDYRFIDMPSGEISDPQRMDTLGYKNFYNNGFCAVAFNMINGLSLLIPERMFEIYGKFDENLRAVQDYKKWFEMFSYGRLHYIDRPLVLSRRHSLQVTYTYSKTKEEAESLYLDIIKHASQEKLNNIGLSLYDFFQKALVHFGRWNYKDVHDYIVKRLLLMNDPKDVVEKLNIFKNWLSAKIDNKDLYLYCAGIQGVAMIEELTLREFPIKGIFDSDKKKWGQFINGFECLPPTEIPKDAALIVTQKAGYDLAKSLKANGLNRVFVNEDIQGMIMNTAVPVKNIKRLFANSIKN